MRKVISYSFFRNAASAYEQPEAGASQGRFFLTYIPALLRAHYSVWRDWDLRIHHDNRVTEYPYFKVLEILAKRDYPLKLVYKGEAERICQAMLWRMDPIWDDYDIVVCRDIDSLETPRSRKAIEKWLEGGQAMHVIHDSMSHSGIMGGTCAFRAQELRRRIPWGTWLKMVNEFDLSRHGSDQHFLNRHLGFMDIQMDSTVRLPEMTDPRDKCDGWARGIGGAYHAGPVADYYDKHYPEDTAIVREAEKEAGL